MTDITFRSDMTVQLLDATEEGDEAITLAAMVSTGWNGDSPGGAKRRGLINYLMKHRHGSPFEHGYLKFRVECPIFVAREFMRHRAGWSFNEVSGRYSMLEPVFWHPDEGRSVKNVGTSARPEMDFDYYLLNNAVRYIKHVSETAWINYVTMIAEGTANEVARAVLPVGIYTSFIASCNPRSLMHFLSLRIDHPENQYDTYPQAEIEDVARQMEQHFKELWPLTWEAWSANGRVAP